MTIGLCVILVCLLTTAIYLLAKVLKSQRELDAPYRGIMIVDRQDEDGKTFVYFQSVVDPITFKDGEIIKLRVNVVK